MPLGATHQLERHANLSLKTAWRHEVSTAKSGLKVIERVFVGQVNDCKTQRQLRVFGAQKIVRTGTEIKKMARCDARRICVVIFRSVCRNTNTQSAAIR